MMNPTSQDQGLNNPRLARTFFSGFTLVEVILVVALLAMVVAVSWPSMDQMLISRRLTDGASQVRSFLRDARRQAMQDGIPYRVDSLDDEGRLRRVPLNEPFEESSESELETPKETESVEETEFAPVRDEIELPNETRMIDDATFDEGPPDPSRKSDPLEPASSSLDSPETAESDTQSWRPIAEFYPDGSSIDTTMKMVDRRPWFIEITIRSLTGEVALGEADLWLSEETREDSEEEDANTMKEAPP